MQLEIETVSSIDSTNSELMRRAHAGDYQTRCLVALAQTAGRGRLGGKWWSSDQCLTFSLGLPLAPRQWLGLSLAVGVSAARSLHDHIRIKWPNDLWLDGRKLGGVLIETTPIKNIQCPQQPAAAQLRYVVVGLGINLEVPPLARQAAQQMNKRAPAGLRELLPRITREQVLAQVLEPLVRDLHSFEAQGWSPFAAGFAKHDALEGLSIGLSSGVHGAYRGVNDQGALLLQTAQGLQTVVSDEVSVCF